MSSITPLPTAPAGVSGASASPAPATPDTSAPAKAPAANLPNQRLLIQEGQQAGVVIYTVLDRDSGKILVQIPNQMVLDLAARPDYAAGQVISTKA